MFPAARAAGLARRAFLQSSLCLTGELLLGCGGDEDPTGAQGGARGSGAGGAEGCANPFERALQLGTAPFINEADLPLNTPYNEGLDGRLLTDLSMLGADFLVTPTEFFYIRTRYPDLLDPSARWTIRVGGLVDTPAELVLDELLPLEESMGTLLLECSGNSRTGHFGLLSAATWHGIPVSAVLDTLRSQPDATRVSISGFDQHSQVSAGGHSTPGASWIFSFDELEEAGAFFATRMNGEPLPADHGAPLRLFVPGWYGCACIKWVDEIALVGDDEPATSQMIEFASRTHQIGTPTLARDYLPATIDQAAMPVRIEKWQLGGRIGYRVVGILWGGDQTTTGLQIRFGNGGWEPVDVCPLPTTNRTWTLWSHLWQPELPGSYAIVLRVDDANVRQRRLDSGYYTREVAIDEV
jgi:DMSO/TMAO reductase YedYZ molybdopterin-dependent catalytic subunit